MMHRESDFIWRAIRWTLLGSAALAVACVLAAAVVVPVAPSSERLEYAKLFAGLFKTVLAGTGVALLGVLVPASLTAERARFARQRASRREFSLAQTATYYLALEMSTLSLNHAARLVNRIHVHKHMAQLYPDLPDQLKRRHDKRDAKQWADEMYEVLTALGRVLEDKAGEWSGLTPKQRVDLLLVAQKAAEKECEEQRARGGSHASPH